MPADRLIFRSCKVERGSAISLVRRPSLSPLTGRSTGLRFPPEIIVRAIRLYVRDVRDLLGERGVVVSQEPARQWCTGFGAIFAAALRRRRVRAADRWHLDEVAFANPVYLTRRSRRT